MKLRNMLGIVTAAAVSALSVSANADTFTYNITSDHSTDQGVTGGTLPNNGVVITVVEGTNVLHLSLAFASGWGLITNGQDQASLVFALPNSLSASITNLSAGLAAVAPQSTLPGIALNGGIFEGGINSLTGYGVIGGLPNSPLTTVSFDINATGITAASLSAGGHGCVPGGGPGICSTSQPPISGIFFADLSHLFAGTTQALTGIVDFGLTAVPLPPAALLFGTALVGMGILGRRRRKDGLAQA